MIYDLEVLMMRKLISCAYHEDSQTVELRYTDGMLIDIDCMAVENVAHRYNITSLSRLKIYCVLYLISFIGPQSFRFVFRNVLLLLVTWRKKPTLPDSLSQICPCSTMYAFTDYDY